MRARLWFVIVLAGLVYCLWPNRAYSFDELSYAQMIERGDLLHPHHLLYNVPGWAVWKALHLLYPVRAVYVLQTLNALGAVLGLYLFQRLTVRLGLSAGAALWSTALLACSYSWWYFAIASETYILPVVALLLGLNLTERMWGPQGQGRRGTRAQLALRCILLATPFTAAACLHQTHALALLVLGAWLRFRRAPFRWSAVTLVSVVALTAAAYQTAYSLHGGKGGFSGMLQWAVSYAREPEFKGAYGLPVSTRNLTLAPKSWGGVISDEHGALAGRIIFVEGLLALSAVFAWFKRRGAADRRALPIGPLLVWLLAYGGFAFWWEPGNMEFLVPLGPAFILLVAAIHQSRLRGQDNRLLGGLATATVLFVLAVNFRHIYHMHRAPHYGERERLVLSVVRPEDVVVLEDWCSPYYTYFGHRSIQALRSLRWAMRYGTGTIGDYVQALAAQIDAHLQAGRCVYAGDLPPLTDNTAGEEVLEAGFPLELWARFSQPARAMTLEDLQSFYRRYEIDLQTTSLGQIGRLRLR
jgi:hypothetical protein